MNSDGFDDLIVGAFQGDDGGSNAGEAYLIYGGDFLGDLIFADQDFFIGTDGVDALIGDGGSDVFRAGAGDDTITPGDASFFRIDGGGGQDTLIIEFDLDLATLANDGSNVIIQSIEAIDITGGGDNDLKLSIDDLLDISEVPNLDHDGNSNNSLVVIGDAGDSVDLLASGAGAVGDGGMWAANGTVSIDAQNFNVYDFSVGGDVLGSIAIDPDIAIVNLNV